LKHYYYECRNCGNQNITNWPLTLAAWVAILLLVWFMWQYLMRAIATIGYR
jgi:hypothetical protein